MKFKQIHRLLILTFVLCSKIIRGDNSEEAKKWHIFGGVLFYSEVEQKYNADEAYQHCKSLGMTNNTQHVQATEFRKHVTSFYGYVPPLLAMNYADCPSKVRGFILSTKTNKKLVNEVCSKKFGFTCEAEILYGEIQFKNGTQLSIKRGDILKYCDTQGGHALDQENCLIVLKTYKY